MSLNIEVVPTGRLFKKRYANILCYPRYSIEEAGKRIRELKKLGVKAIEFSGERLISDVSVLGKGHVGVVVTAYTKNGKAALKIRRVDADRNGMRHEAEMLLRANRIGVGPRFLGLTENFLLMELVEGRFLPEWVSNMRRRGSKKGIQIVLRGLLVKCWRLDEEGLDHGELSRAPKHIIVDAKNVAHLIDFETASINRRPSNVTSLCQYLFIGSQLGMKIQRRIGEVSRENLIASLRSYKRERTEQNFIGILQVCRLNQAQWHDFSAGSLPRSMNSETELSFHNLLLR